MFRQMAITRWILRCIPLIAILASAPAYAQQSFENVAGSWSGGGMMKASDGPRQRVRCKADYVPKNNGQSVKLNLRCTSDAYKRMDLKSDQAVPPSAPPAQQDGCSRKLTRNG
jgi:hypothetical protein